MIDANQSLKILCLAAECTPFYKVGGLADVIGSLPHTLRQLGHDARVMMPRYRSINSRRYKLRREDGFVDVPAGDSTRMTEVLQSSATGVPTYFVWDERFFGRQVVYGQPDEAMAFAFFCRAAIEFLRSLDWTPDVIHCHDWHTGCAVTYLSLAKDTDARLKSIASVFTIHNVVYQGVTGEALLRYVGIDRHQHIKGEQPGTVNWLARGIAHADVVNTVSPTYAAEILTPEFGAGLDGLLRSRRGRVSGVLNGIDRDEWNPLTDAALAAQFDAGSIRQRAVNKRALQTQLGLKRKPRVPLLGLVGRLVEQKGIDVLLGASERLLKRDVQLAILGSGEPRYEAALDDLQQRYPGRVGVEHNFDDRLGRLIYGGSDMFLMPSHFEPCGLSQMIAMRYGSVPIVRATGGLVDTVVDAGRSPRRGVGFTFKPYTAAGLLHAIDRALIAYADAGCWSDIQRRAMTTDFSWQASAGQYVALYHKAIALHKQR